MITQTMNIDMTPGGIPPILHVSQYDTGSRVFVFRLRNAGEMPSLSGISAVIEGIKPDGNFFSYDVEYADGVVTADCVLQMTPVEGKVLCTLKLSQGEDVLRTANFVLMVDKKPMPSDAVVSETEIPVIIELGKQYAESAEVSADDSAKSAAASDTAHAAAVVAQKKAETAQSKAETAQGKAETSETNAKASQVAAQEAKTLAESSEKNAEAWAVGQRGGVDVGTADKTYHNNSKYYANQASDSATSAKSYAHGGTGSRTGEDNDNAEYYSRRSQNSAVAAASSATSAAESLANVNQIIEEALQENAPIAWVDLDTGLLMYEGGKFLFEVDTTTGNLLWSIAA